MSTEPRQSDNEQPDNEQPDNNEQSHNEQSPNEPQSKLDLRFVPPEDRDGFDTDVAQLIGVITPPPGISDALMASLVDEDTEKIVGTAGFAYMQVRHVVSPLVLAEGNQHALAPMLDVFTSQLRAHVRETELATHTGVSPDTDRGLSYDVYVPDGAGLEPPDGFEVLPIRVWRRRVC